MKTMRQLKDEFDDTCAEDIQRQSQETADVDAERARLAQERANAGPGNLTFGTQGKQTQQTQPQTQHPQTQDLFVETDASFAKSENDTWANEEKGKDVEKALAYSVLKSTMRNKGVVNNIENLKKLSNHYGVPIVGAGLDPNTKKLTYLTVKEVPVFETDPKSGKRFPKLDAKQRQVTELRAVPHISFDPLAIAGECHKRGIDPELQQYFWDKTISSGYTPEQARRALGYDGSQIVRSTHVDSHAAKLLFGNKFPEKRGISGFATDGRGGMTSWTNNGGTTEMQTQELGNRSQGTWSEVGSFFEGEKKMRQYKNSKTGEYRNVEDGAELPWDELAMAKAKQRRPGGRTAEEQKDIDEHRSQAAAQRDAEKMKHQKEMLNMKALLQRIKDHPGNVERTVKQRQEMYLKTVGDFASLNPEKTQQELERIRADTEAELNGKRDAELDAAIGGEESGGSEDPKSTEKKEEPKPTEKPEQKKYRVGEEIERNGKVYVIGEDGVARPKKDK